MELIFSILSSAVAFLPTGQAGLNTFSAKGKSISRPEGQENEYASQLIVAL